jgi:hypothetical protein
MALTNESLLSKIVSCVLYNDSLSSQYVHLSFDKEVF